MTAAKKPSPIPKIPAEGNPEEPALAQDAISQVAGRGTAQAPSTTEPTLTPSPPIIPPQATVVNPPSAFIPVDKTWMYDAHLNDTMPPAEDTTVDLLRTTTYSMPGTCPVCNEARLGGTGKIQTSNSYRSGNMKYTLSLAFPICQKCTDIQTLFTKQSNKAALLGLPFGVVALVLTFVIGMSGASGSVFGEMICPGILIGLAAWGIAWGISNAILNRKFPKTLKDRHSRIGNAASISSFSPTHVSFKFKSKAYAAAFQLLNSVGGINLMQQMLDSLNKKQSK